MSHLTNTALLDTNLSSDEKVGPWSPLSHRSTDSSSVSSTDTPTSSDTSFYDYLLTRTTRKGSKIDKELYEILKNQNTGLSEASKTAIPGYMLLSSISNELYRGFNQKTRRSVLIKYTPYVSAGSMSRYFNEWYTLSGLSVNQTIDIPMTLPPNLEGILYPEEMFVLDNDEGYVMIYEDVLNLKSVKELYQYTDKNKLSKLIIKFLEALTKIHRLGFTHNGITSSNILINDNDEVYLTGWDFCFSVTNEDCTRGYRTLNKRYLIEWLPYMAPESSGEVNKLVDYRSDLYSVGVVLYQICVGSLPFIASDAREIINSHIKEVPSAPETFGVDPRLSNIIMKLLSKSPLHRYQGSDLLLIDLKKILTGEKHEDVYRHSFILPDGIYGRETQIESIKKLYINTDPGVHLVLLTGDSGVGKTRLVNQIQSEIVTINRYFASWKCNFKMSGLASFLSILNDTFHQILAGSEVSLNIIREDIKTTLGSLDLSTVFAYLPELKDVLGPNYARHLQTQPTDQFYIKPELRFRQILKLLFVALGKSAPLTILFDDFQWFSTPDLQLIHEIRTEISNLAIDSSIIVFSTFDSSKGNSIEDLKRNLNCDILEIPVEPISYKDLEDYMIDATIPQREVSLALNSEPLLSEDQIKKIVEVSYRKVGGYPLSIQMLFFDYIVDQLLNHDDSSYIEPVTPTINLEEYIDQSGDLNALYRKRVNYFTEECLEILKVIGSLYDKTPFSLNDLVTASDLPIDVVARFISKAIKLRLILPTNIYYKFPFHLPKDKLPLRVDSRDIEDLATLALFTVYHDSFHQFIQTELMSKDNESKDSYRVTGLRLFKKWESSDQSEMQMEFCLGLARLMSKSYEMIRDTEEAAIYLKVLKTAQSFCYKIYDFSSALRFFKISKIIMEKHNNGDKAGYVNLLIETTKCLLMTKNYAETVEFIEAHSDVFQRDANVVLYKIQALSMLDRREECMKIGLSYLKANKIYVETNAQWFLPYLAELKSKLPTSITDIRRLLSNIKSASKKTSTIHGILTEMILISNQNGTMYFSSALAHILVFHSLNHGLSVFSSLGFIILSIDQIKSSTARAKEFSQFGLSLLKAKNVPLDFINNVYFIYCATVGGYLEPLRELIKYYDLISSASSQISATNSTAFALRVCIKPLLQILNGFNCSNIYHHLINTVREVELEDRTNRLWFKITATLLRFYLQLPYDEKYDIEQEFNDDRKLEDETYFIQCFYFACVSLSSSSSTPQKVFKNFNEEKLLSTKAVLPHMLTSILSEMKQTFIKLDNPHYTAEDKKREANNTLMFFSHCKSQSPELFESKCLCLEAEILKLEGNVSDLDVLDRFSEAIDAAKENKLNGDVCMINERCGKWLYENFKGKRRTLNHLKESFQYAKLCGLNSQIVEMKEKYSEIFQKVKTEVFDDPGRKRVSEVGSSINYILSSVLRTDSISTDSATLEPELDNSQMMNTLNLILAISESINIDSILEKLIKSTFSVLDADYAAVALLNENSNIEFKAVGSPSEFKYLEESETPFYVPEDLIQRVIESGELYTNSKDASFSAPLSMNRSYFFKSKPKSVLCLPIKNELEVVGAIYIESSKNSQMVNDRNMNLQTLLCTQAAFALDKSRLYHNTILAKKAAEEATQEKAAFLANMSHEIRTPFNSLFACAGFLLDTKLDPLQQEYVETIQSSSKATLNIIDAILTFSKIEHGSLYLQVSDFSVSECIESAMKLVAEQAVEKGLELAFFDRVKGAGLIKADITRFRQVIINLLGNAIKFTMSGSIIVECFAKQVSAAGVRQFLISIKDTGIGIPKNSHSKVFGAFSQVDGSSRRVFGGSGLGLAISKKLVDLMGGTLTFESNEGEGTTFYFSITSEVTSSSKEEKYICNQEKIVIIDDEGAARDSLEYELKSNTSFKMDVFRDISKAQSLDKYAIAFLNFKFYEELTPEVLESISNHRIVIMNSYGRIIPNEILIKNHKVLLLPFERLKLKNIVQSIFVPEKEPFKPVTVTKPLLKDNLKALDEKPKMLLSDEFPLDILLVEDNMINTRVALQHLKKFGYTADSAVHGIEALKRCHDRIEKTGNNYDLILMDIQMPYKDGIETAFDLQSLYKEKGLVPTIVALTANVEREDRDRCIACGMSDFISKPILPEVLGRVLRTVAHVQNA